MTRAQERKKRSKRISTKGRANKRRVKSNRSSAHIPNVTKTVNFGSVSGNQHLINILTPSGSMPASAEGVVN